MGTNPCRPMLTRGIGLHPHHGPHAHCVIAVTGGCVFFYFGAGCWLLAVQVFVDLISQAPVTAKESLYGIKFLCELPAFHAQVRGSRHPLSRCFHGRYGVHRVCVNRVSWQLLFRVLCRDYHDCDLTVTAGHSTSIRGAM